MVHVVTQKYNSNYFFTTRIEKAPRYSSPHCRSLSDRNSTAKRIHFPILFGPQLPHMQNNRSIWGAFHLRDAKEHSAALCRTVLGCLIEHNIVYNYNGRVRFYHYTSCTSSFSFFFQQ